MCGVMIHPYWGIHKLLPLLRQMQEELDVKMEFIDLGGGFDKSSSRTVGTTDLVKVAVRRRLGMRSGLDRWPRKAREILEESRLIASEVKSIPAHTESTCVLEPGRYLVHDTGFLALRIGVVKKVAGQNWIITDGGSCNLVPDFHERREIRIAKRANAQPEEMVNISGPLPNAWDLVRIKKFLPRIRAGDYIVLSNAGAYTLSLSRQFCYPRPAAVLVRPNGKAILIRQKGTGEDVTRMDRLEGLGQLQSRIDRR